MNEELVPEYLDRSRLRNHYRQAILGNPGVNPENAPQNCEGVVA